MNGGEYRDGIEWAKSKGLTHAFTVAAQEMATKPGGLTYAMLANVTPNVKVLKVSKDGGTCYAPTVKNVSLTRVSLRRPSASTRARSSTKENGLTR